MQVLNVRYTGNKELMMHNERLANPLDKITQELKAATSKRKKSDADFMLISEIEFRGGIYFDAQLGPVIPDRVIRKSMIVAARKMKLGKEIEENVLVLNPASALEYDGPRTLPGLWKAGFYDQRMVGNQKQRVLRTRPKFPVGWSTLVQIQYDDEAIDRRSLEAVLKRSETLGLCDFRPLYGTFTTKIEGAGSLDRRLAA